MYIMKFLAVKLSCSQSSALRQRCDGICEIDLCQAKRKFSGILCVLARIFTKHGANIAAKTAQELPQGAANKKRPRQRMLPGAIPLLPLGPMVTCTNKQVGRLSSVSLLPTSGTRPGGLQSADSNRHPLLEMWVYWANVNNNTAHKAGVCLLLNRYCPKLGIIPRRRPRPRRW